MITSTKSTVESTSKNVTDEAPWIKPTVKKNPEYTLESLRDVKQLISSGQEQEKRLKVDMQELYDGGDLDHLRDPEDEQKFNHHGVTATLCKGRIKRQWDPEVQEQLDQLQQQIKDVGLRAESALKFTESRGSSYWTVRVEKEV